MMLVIGKAKAHRVDLPDIMVVQISERFGITGRSLRKTLRLANTCMSVNLVDVTACVLRSFDLWMGLPAKRFSNPRKTYGMDCATIPVAVCPRRRS